MNHQRKLKIAFLGAGSIGFGRRLVADILSYPELAESVLEEKIEYVYHAAMLDPNTSSQLTLPQIRSTIDRLLEAQSQWAVK